MLEKTRRNQVIDGTHNGLQDFTFGLDLILDGLESIRKSG